MGRVWDADVSLDETLAVRLIRSQFPSVSVDSLEQLGVGWDNVAYLVDRRWVFRFPRRKVAADLILHESQALPLIAPHVPLPIPNPAFLGSPSIAYPYPFAGYELIPGRSACAVTWSDEARSRCAAPLGEFLKCLHSIPISDEVLATMLGDEIGRCNLQRLFKITRERAGELPASYRVDRVLSKMGELVQTDTTLAPRCFVHGDFYACHFVVDEALGPTGVIDWGDVHMGHPGLDLSIAYSFLPPRARELFFGAYGPVPESTRDFARFRALFYGIVLTHYGLDVGNEGLRLAGEYSLANAILS